MGEVRAIPSASGDESATCNRWTNMDPVICYKKVREVLAVDPRRCALSSFDKTNPFHNKPFLRRPLMHGKISPT